MSEGQISTIDSNNSITVEQSDLSKTGHQAGFYAKTVVAVNTVVERVACPSSGHHICGADQSGVN